MGMEGMRWEAFTTCTSVGTRYDIHHLRRPVEVVRRPML